VSLFNVETSSPLDRKQGRLMQLAALFLLLFSIILTLSPAVRMHSWQADLRWNHWIGFTVWLLSSAFIHRQIIRRFPERDPFLFPVAALLCGWGLLTIWRLDSTMGSRQTIWLGVCLGVVWAGMLIPNLLELLRRYKYVWLTSALLLTATTFLIGTYPGGEGPRLWLGCCGVYLQPSEPLKLLLIVYLAAYLADHLPISFNLTSLLTPTLIMGGTTLALLVTQRDLGTASLFILIYTVIIYLASGKQRILVISGLLLLAAGIAGYLLFDVVRIRVDAWLNPWLDPSGRSFQIVQSILAVAAGDFIGRGPGMGSPGLVPVAHSDFIFAAIAEETGLLGVIGLLGLYALIVGRGFRVALFAPNNYQRYLAGGLTAYLAIQAIFIMGGNLRLLPLTGVTLPFVSYGGSSLLTAFVAILLLLQISYPDELEPAPMARPVPFLLVSSGLLAGLVALALVSGWWGIVRDQNLLARPDNPRRAINDRYVQRGALIDRNNQPINQTIGQPGSYQRVYEYAPLSPTTGYSSFQFGQSGLEAGLDGYLRGLRGNLASRISWDYLLFGQPPPGLDVRLTIDLELQRLAESLLGDYTGALVLLNATSGDILAISSHPYFDPSQVDQNWQQLVQAAEAPLLNRATQGQYPPGSALGPFLLSYALSQSQGNLPAVPVQTDLTIDGIRWTCALPPDNPAEWAELVANGCPAGLAALSEPFSAVELDELFNSLGFYQAPNLPLPVAASSTLRVQQVTLSAIGQENLTVTPLQMALAAAALTNDGIRPTPNLASTVQTPHQGWVVLTSSETEATLLANRTTGTMNMLSMQNGHFWQVTGAAQANNESALAWYLAGTLPDWQGTPLALALVLEGETPQSAQEIGRALIQGATQ
jgi:cell division protein FtsW (lipid II flippase)